MIQTQTSTFRSSHLMVDYISFCLQESSESRSRTRSIGLCRSSEIDSYWRESCGKGELLFSLVFLPDWETVLIAISHSQIVAFLLKNTQERTIKVSRLCKAKEMYEGSSFLGHSMFSKTRLGMAVKMVLFLIVFSTQKIAGYHSKYPNQVNIKPNNYDTKLKVVNSYFDDIKIEKKVLVALTHVSIYDEFLDHFLFFSHIKCTIKLGFLASG